MQSKHAVFATVKMPGRKAGRIVEDSLTFRLGQPTTWDKAISRWDRLDRRRMGRGLKVKHDGRSYPVAFVEVRATDRVGRGLGQPRHEQAMPKPLRRDHRSTTFTR